MQNKTNGKIDQELIFNRNVEAVRQLLKKNKQSLQIAELCYEATEIVHGGKHSDLFTLAEFAKRTSINHKTLYNWVALYKDVYLKLNDKEKQRATIRSLKDIKLYGEISKTKSISDVHAEIKTIKALELTVVRYGQSLKSLRMATGNPLFPHQVSKEVCEELLFYLDAVKRGVLVARPGLTAKNHFYFTKQAGSSDYNSLLMGEYNSPVDKRKIKITKKDQKVFKYLSKFRGKFLSPTRIALTLDPTKNKSSASAWACRSLQKLQELQFVERSADGEYSVSQGPFMSNRKHKKTKKGLATN